MYQTKEDIQAIIVYKSRRAAAHSACQKIRHIIDDIEEEKEFEVLAIFSAVVFLIASLLIGLLVFS